MNKAPTSKKLQMDSKHNAYDDNSDGVVTDEELESEKTERAIENADKKESQQRKMAWVAMLSMIIFTLIMLTPLISDDRVNALSSIFSMFYVAQAGVVATFFGVQAYINR